ncbi:MAG TPA: hypothetical protein VIH00_13055, partial [Candidatus Limnocylindrales bacterium]
MIPILKVSGTHREVGRQIGEATAAVVRAAVAFDDALPPDRTRGEQLDLARAHRDVTVAATPWLV